MDLHKLNFHKLTSSIHYATQTLHEQNAYGNRLGVNGEKERGIINYEFKYQ